MNLEIERVTGGLRLAGELDLAGEPAVQEALAPLLGGEDVLVDISDLSFIDSSGVRALLRAASGMRGEAQLILHRPSAPVMRVFELMRLDAVPNVQIREPPTEMETETEPEAETGE